MWPNPQSPADLVTFTEEILNGKFHFLCSDRYLVIIIIIGRSSIVKHDHDYAISRPFITVTHMLVIILKRGSDVWMINVQPALKKPQTIKSINHTSTY